MDYTFFGNGTTYKKSLDIDKRRLQYEYGIVINYNTTKPVKGAGSAFFLHVDNGRPAAGCVSIPESRMIKLMKELNSNAYIIIVNKTSEIVNY